MASKKTALTIALGSAFAASLSMAPAAHAAENPFAMQTLHNGYMVADAGDKAAEAKCGSAKKKAEAAAKAKEAKCGSAKKKAEAADKAKEAKCGANKKSAETM
jgi:uncharacterized low-complexity protein